MVIKNNEGMVVSEAQAIAKYFRNEQTEKLQDFMGQIKALTPEAKTELAVGAAKELGWTVEA